MKIRGIFSEEEILEFFGIDKERLAYLRKARGFPFTPITQWKRVYREQAIQAWIIEHEGEILE